jgi:type IV pilus assembly protein PilB
MSLYIYRDHKLVQRLLDREIITRGQLDEAIATQRSEMKGSDLVSVLVTLGYMTLDHLCADLAERFDMEFVKIAELDIDPHVLGLLHRNIAQFYRVVPIAERDETLVVAMDDPTNIKTLERISESLERPVDAVVATPDDVSSALRRYYGDAAK